MGHQRWPHSLCGDGGAAPPETPMWIAGKVGKMVVHQMREQGMLTTTSPTSERECGGKVWGTTVKSSFEPSYPKNHDSVCIKHWPLYNIITRKVHDEESQV